MSPATTGTEALCQVSEKCILFHTRTHIFPWKLEISGAVAQYSTTEVVSSKEDLGFQDQTTEIKTPQQQYFTIKTLYMQCDRNSILQVPAIQAGYIYYFTNKYLCNMYLLHLTEKKDPTTDKKRRG